MSTTSKRNKTDWVRALSDNEQALAQQQEQLEYQRIQSVILHKERQRALLKELLEFKKQKKMYNDQAKHRHKNHLFLKDYSTKSSQDSTALKDDKTSQSSAKPKTVSKDDTPQENSENSEEGKPS